MKEGRPFLEVLGSVVHEDYRLPMLELFVFLFALGQFVFVDLNVAPSMRSNELVLYWLATSATGTTLLVFMVLIFKNIAYGFSNDIERGTLQTYLSYPLGRKRILTAKLLSAIGVAVLLFLGIQTVALLIQAPDLILPNVGLILLLYATNLSYVLLVTSIILLFALFIKRGVPVLVIGIAIYLIIGIVTSIALLFASIGGSATLVQAVALVNPSTALSAHYGYAPENVVWSPSFTEVSYYVAVNYAVIAALFLLAYYYFSRRLDV